MTTTAPMIEDRSAASRAAIECEDGGPFMVADWVRPLMLHYEVDADALSAAIPFEVDLHDGRAFVSIVSFEMRHLRLAVGGRWVEALSAGMMPPCSHAFLNVRAYVRWRGEIGIYFLSEWVPSRVARFFGPRTFGLPYRLGTFDGAAGADGHRSRVIVRDEVADAAFSCSTQSTASAAPRTASPGSLDHFLMERYTAYTFQHGVRRRFRVWHEPWRFAPVEVSVDQGDLLLHAWPGMAGAQVDRAAACDDLHGVWMSRPHWIATDLP